MHAEPELLEGKLHVLEVPFDKLDPWFVLHVALSKAGDKHFSCGMEVCPAFCSPA